MKRIASFLLSVILICTACVPAFAASTSYGGEWENYEKDTTVSYTDVSRDHWAWNAIVKCTDKKWFGGYPDKSFRPSGTITRAEALKVFVVFLGLELKEVTESSFYDVDPDEWYAPYIEAGKDLFPKYTTIQGKTPFKPDTPVTREDTIYALVRALGLDVGQKFVDESVLNMFKDKSSISKGMGKYFTIALNNELVGGYPDSTIRAQASLNRAEFATLLSRGVDKGRPVNPDIDDNGNGDDNGKDDGEISDTGTYTIEYQNVPEYANSAQSRFPTTYSSDKEVILGTPTWPGRDFDCWEVVEGKVENNRIVRGTTGNIVLKAHWLNSENISIPSIGEIVSCIQNPVDGCYYFTYKIGTITKIPVADKYTPKRAGNGVAVELQTETTTEISTEYGNTIAESISTAVSTTESWKNTSKWAVGASLSRESEASAGVEFPVEAVKVSLSAKKNTKFEISGSYEEEYETGGSIESSYSAAKSSSITLISSNTEIKAQTEYYRIPADYPDGYYSYRTTVDADVYAVVKYDTNNKSYYLSTFSVLGNPKESLFYESAGVSSPRGVNTKYNKLEYDVPVDQINQFFNSDRYTVKLDYNNGTGKIDNLEVLVGEAVYLPTPKNSDGSFYGWEYNTNNSVKIYMGDTAEIFNARNGEVVTIKAKWGECNVSYSLGEGGGLLAVPTTNATYKGNNAVIIYDASNFTYKFVNSSNDDPYVTINGEAYLKEGKTYYVHMNVADTAVNSNSVQLFYAIGGAYTEAASVRFGGDSIKTIKPAKTGYYNFRIDNDTKTNITITDFWVSDIDLTPKAVKFNAPYGNLPIPTRVGYSFDGWYYNGAKVTSSTTVIETDAHTLVAKWSSDPLLKKEYSTSASGLNINIRNNSNNYELIIKTGMDKGSLVANGYTKLKLHFNFTGRATNPITFNTPRMRIFSRTNNVIYDGSHNAFEGSWGAWTQRNVDYTMSIDDLNSDGSFRTVWSTSGGSGSDGWCLDKYTITVTATK